MIERTSIDSYYDERNKRQLGREQRAVLWLIRKFPCSTDRELALEYHKAFGGLHDSNKVRPRRAELVKSGLVEEAGKRTCGVTGKVSMTWRIVTHQPQKELFSE